MSECCALCEEKLPPNGYLFVGGPPPDKIMSHHKNICIQCVEKIAHAWETYDPEQTRAANDKLRAIRVARGFAE